ncbi:hypothetical protein LCGC14_0726050 [marine sediment metagenome]|uniref:Uncharacterized protein n=1 Tax=marine sediment metagenome TaxID=412755 RepID=A0A0F9QB16_9ZZZZ
MTQEVTETTQEILPSPTEAVEAQATPTGAEEPQPTPAEGPEAAAPTEKPPLAWATVEDPYDVLDLDDFKPILERRSGLIEEGLREDFQGRLEAATSNWESTNLHSTLSGITGNLTEQLEASNLEGAEKAIARLEKFREPYMEAHENGLQAKGATAMAGQSLRSMLGLLDVRSQETLYDLAKRTTGSWEPVFKKFLELGGKKDYERGLTENRDAASERKKLEARQGQGANLAPGSPAGGADDNKRLLDPTTPIDEITAIRARQKAAGE